MVRWFIEDQKIRASDERTAESDTPLFPAGKGFDDPLRSGGVQIGNQALDPVLDIPSIEMIYLIQQCGAERTLPWKIFVLLDQSENMPSPGKYIRAHGL